jgi:hypothetical protein
MTFRSVLSAIGSSLGADHAADDGATPNDAEGDDD